MIDDQWDSPEEEKIITVIAEMIMEGRHKESSAILMRGLVFIAANIGIDLDELIDMVINNDD